MQNHYPLWKNCLIVFIICFAFLYALPNVFGEDPAIQITPASSSVALSSEVKEKIVNTLEEHKYDYKSMEMENKELLIRFKDTDTQLEAKDVVKAVLGGDFTVASNIAPATPAWLEAIGAEPMKLGLDLRGGVHFLLEIDVESVIARRSESMVKSIGKELRENHIRYLRLKRTREQGLSLTFRGAQARDKAYNLIRRSQPQLLLNRFTDNGYFKLTAKMSPANISEIKQYTLEQTMTTLRNRVNELGVGEAVVQQQGANRIAVDLPGIQDAARAKQILGGTATLEFRMVDTEHDARSAAAGMVPVGSKLYTDETGNPILLYNQVILSGDSITSANASFSPETGLPSVNIQLGGGGESLFSRTTRANIGKRMGIVFIETKTENKLVNGKVVRKSKKIEKVISAPRINDALGVNFQITGLSDPEESKNLALLLRAGALPAAIYPVEERIVGPTLGLENIKRGIVSLEVGLVLVLIIMLVYYRVFGIFANIALFLNLVLLVAALSLLGATLTLPGIAGIVLTLGMAVDANVLIYERIREELRNGVSVQAAIFAGYERALPTIIDANVTTLIVVLVLFAIGSGPVQGFAVTTSIGLLTSMLTGITFTRAMVNFVYGNRVVKSLSIGI